MKKSRNDIEPAIRRIVIAVVIIGMALLIIIRPHSSSGGRKESSDRAVSVPDRPQSYVLDSVGVLSEEEESSLNEKLKKYDAKTGNQIAVLLVRTTGKESIEKYSYKVATKWGVGKKGKDNGILITIATEDHKDRIEVGKGLEEDVTDSRAGRILRSNDVTTAFRGKRWYDGTGSIVSQVQECIRTKGKSAERIYSSKDIMSGYSIVMTVLGVAGEYLKKKGKILYWIGAAVVDYFAYTRFHVSLLPMLLITIVMGLAAHGIIRVRSSSSSSSGGSSSFGGGSFGGGGASGDW